MGMEDLIHRSSERVPRRLDRWLAIHRCIAMTQEFMGPYVDSVMSDELMPAATSVVIIGGGIIGTSAALTLAARGIPVVLCEKGVHRLRTIQPQLGLVPTGRTRRARDAADRRELAAVARHGSVDGQRDTGFRECGVMYVGENPSRMSAFPGMARDGAPYRHRHAHRARRGTRGS